MPASIQCPASCCQGRLQFQVLHTTLPAQVGLNLANREPTTCVDALIEQAAAAAAAEAAERGGERQQGQAAPLQGSIVPVGREELLAGIVNRLEPMLDRLATEGFAPFEEEYCRHWLHSGQQVGQGSGWGGRSRQSALIRGLRAAAWLSPPSSGLGRVCTGWPVSGLSRCRAWHGSQLAPAAGSLGWC